MDTTLDHVKKARLGQLSNIQTPKQAHVHEDTAAGQESALQPSAAQVVLKEVEEQKPKFEAATEVGLEDEEAADLVIMEEGTAREEKNSEFEPATHAWFEEETAEFQLVPVVFEEETVEEDKSEFKLSTQSCLVEETAEFKFVVPVFIQEDTVEEKKGEIESSSKQSCFEEETAEFKFPVQVILKEETALVGDAINHDLLSKSTSEVNSLR
jgi:hypothetical protein